MDGVPPAVFGVDDGDGAEEEVCGSDEKENGSAESEEGCGDVQRIPSMCGGSEEENVRPWMEVRGGRRTGEAVVPSNGEYDERGETSALLTQKRAVLTALYKGPSAPTLCPAQAQQVLSAFSFRSPSLQAKSDSHHLNRQQQVPLHKHPNREIVLLIYNRRSNHPHQLQPPWQGGQMYAR